MMESAACPQNKEQEKEGSAGHNHALDHVGDDYCAETADGGVNNDNCCEQKQRPFIRQSGDGLQEGCASNKLRGHLGREEDDQCNAADNDDGVGLVARAEIVRDGYCVDAA